MASTGKVAVRRAGCLASGAALAAAAALALLVLGPALAGWERFAIVSGSMAPSFDRGSLVLADVVPVASLRVGDVITYRPPAGDHLITHRIHALDRDPSGARIFRTKGDANPTPDPWAFTLDRPEQARARVMIPYAGSVLSALDRRDVRLAVVALPALLIAAASLAGLWRTLGVTAAERQAA